MAHAVKFVRPYKGTALYNAGEVAGFPAKEAEKLLSDGVAVPLEVPTEAKPVVISAKVGNIRK